MSDQKLTTDEVELLRMVRDYASAVNHQSSRALAELICVQILSHYREVRPYADSLPPARCPAGGSESLATMADMMQRITELEAGLADAGEQIRLLEICLKDMERDYRTELRQNVFAAQVLSGEFDPPTIAEIRKARGLEPL